MKRSLVRSISNALLILEILFILAANFDDLNMDLFSTEGGKSRKSSGFSETTGSGGSKSRQCSGYDHLAQSVNGKSRNLSGSSISQGLVSSGILSNNGHSSQHNSDQGSNPVMIPGSNPGKSGSPGHGSPNGIGQNGHDHHNSSSVLGMNQLGLFDLTASSPKTAESVKDLEISRLKDELNAAR